MMAIQVKIFSMKY